MAKKRRRIKPKEKRVRLYFEQNGLCYYCKEKMVLREYDSSGRVSGKDATIEHLNMRGTPERRPGKYKTLVAACYDCNWTKGKEYQEKLNENPPPN